MLHGLATAYGTRPSRILGVKNSWVAYQLDLCCLVVGRRVENALAKKYPVDWILGSRTQAEGKAIGRGFRDARAFVRRKVKVPESGVW